MNRIASLGLLLVGLVAVEGEADTLHRFQATQEHMGVDFTIVLYAVDDSTANRGFEKAFARIEALDQILSNYKPESEICQLSRSSPHSEPVPISEDLLHVLCFAQKRSEESGGAFDVSIGPLTMLWRRARLRHELPREERIAQALAATGYEWIEINEAAQTVRLLQPGMRLDLGGIAKGYAIDEALAQLTEEGISRALINGGGDIGASDPPPDEAGWLIGLAALEPGGEPNSFVRLNNNAVATSGDAFQFVEIEGIRYSHIVDPQTGIGLTQRCSVSVMAPNCMAADSLASALALLDPEAGMQLVDPMCGTYASIILASDEGETTLFRSVAFPLVDAPHPQCAP